MKKNITLLITALLLSYTQIASAQTNSNATKSTDRWYVGAGTGISFGSSTFQSFGADKTRVGWTLGALGGYHINSYLSAEASFDYTRMRMESYNCCQTLWLNNMGNRFINSGRNRQSYSDLYSRVNLYQLGLHLNVDFLRMFIPETRWSVMLSPGIYGIGSTSNIKLKQDNSSFYKANSNFHFGVGGDLGVGYQVNKMVNVRLYSGVNYITGSPIDGLPRVEHKSNYVWNTGVKVSFAIGKKNRSPKIKQTKPVDQPYQTEEIREVVAVEPQQQAQTPVTTPAKEKITTTTISIAPEKTIDKTTIYFNTNSNNVKKQYYYGIAKFLNKAKESNNAKIYIDGWADKTGNDNINNRISLLRAEILRNYFISQGINAERITYKGNGVDKNAPTNQKARRSDVRLTIHE